MNCRDAAQLSSINGAIRSNKPGFVLIARFCDVKIGPPMFFRNVYHLADCSSGRYALVFRANRWSEQPPHGIPTVFEEDADDWKPFEGIAGLPGLISRLEPLRDDLSEFCNSSPATITSDLRRLHDEVITKMQGQQFVVKTRSHKTIRYSIAEDMSFFSGPQTAPIAVINVGSEKCFTMAGIAEQFTTRKRVEIYDRHESVYLNFLKLSEFVDELNKEESIHRLALSGCRHSEKWCNSHWTFTIDIFLAGIASKRINYIYLNDHDLPTALSCLDSFRVVIGRAKLIGSARITLITTTQSGSSSKNRGWQLMSDDGIEEFPL